MSKDQLHELVEALPEHQVTSAGNLLESLLEQNTQKQDHDLEILNRNSDYFNQEATDVLDYQVGL